MTVKKTTAKTASASKAKAAGNEDIQADSIAAAQKSLADAQAALTKEKPATLKEAVASAAPTKSDEAAPADKAEEKPEAKAEKKPAAKKTTTRKRTTAKKAEPANEADAEKKDSADKPAATKRAAAKKTTATKKTTTKKAATTKAASTKAAATKVASNAEVKEAASKTQDASNASASAKVESKVESAAKEAAKKIAEEASKPEFADVPAVLIAAAEAAPLAKTGGLADVVGALPKYLKELGIDARIIMPFHRIIKERYASEAEHLFDYNTGPQWPSRFVGIDKLELDDTIYYFVDNEYYFGGNIYSGDNFEGTQYGFFVQAVCDVIPNLDFNPGIIHCNDWHTALIPLKLKAKAAREGVEAPKTLLTIHNLAFQGTFGDDVNSKLIGGDEYNYAWDLGCWNMMKAGIDTADYVSTVSPTYSYEITTPEFGEGLQNDLRFVAEEGRLWGILNGIDNDAWNPATDKLIESNFSAKSPKGKLDCKQALLKELGLDEDMDAPVFAMIGRLTPQKGINLAYQVIETLVPEGAKFIILGSGYPDLEWLMRDAEMRHKGRVCSYIGYNSDLSHRIYAGADFFLMPSAFEPCGISQMIAMRYGALPIVHEIGGLKDTVAPYNQFTDEGNGFTFSRFDGWDAVDACHRALSVYADGDIMRRLIQNALNTDFGMERCAHTYAELYKTMA